MSGRVRDDVEYEDQEEDEEDRSSYYGGASVPFTWESRPGTPKHNHFPDCSFSQPLTPPPSYYSAEILSTPKKQTSSQTKVRTKLTKILSMSLFHDLRKSSSKSSKKTTNHVSGGSSYSWSSTSTSTSSSSSLSSSPPHSLRKPVSHGNKSQVRYASYKAHELASSPTSTLCYNSNGGKKGFSSSMGSMKRALFSGPRHGSGDIYKA